VAWGGGERAQELLWGERVPFPGSIGAGERWTGVLHGEVSLAGLLAMADGMGGLGPWLCSREWRVRGWRLGTRFATWPKGGWERRKAWPWAWRGGGGPASSACEQSSARGEVRMEKRK